jgi:hypothetical protein
MLLWIEGLVIGEKLDGDSSRETTTKWKRIEDEERLDVTLRVCCGVLAPTKISSGP